MWKYFCRTVLSVFAALNVGLICAGASPQGDLTSPASVVLIGDSRLEGMYYTVGASGCAWEYKTAMGYSWLKNTAVYEAEPLIGDGTDVIIMLGINDIGSTAYADQYAAFLNEKALQWKALGASVFYVSVTQCAVHYHNAYGVDNNHVLAWNERIQTLLSEDVIYLDADAQFGTPGTVDGVHYSAGEYRELYEIVLDLAAQARDETGHIKKRHWLFADEDGLILDLVTDEDETEADVELFDIYSFAE